MLGHTHLFTVQYLSTITICRDVLQVIREREREREKRLVREKGEYLMKYSPFSLHYTLGIANYEQAVTQLMWCDIILTYIS